MFPNHDEMNNKNELNNRKKFGQITSMWKLKYKIL